MGPPHIKQDKDDKILRYKTRIVIHRFKKYVGIHYDKTYSHVVRIPIMLMMLLIMMFLALETRHVDFEISFLIYGWMMLPFSWHNPSIR